jgi:tetratricopeptide (TPR) repeat protein
MKTTSIALFVILIITSCNNNTLKNREVNDFISEAVIKANTANRILVVEFWAPECGPCIRLKRDIFNNSKTRAYLDSTFMVVQVSPTDSIFKLLWDYFNLDSQCTIIYFNRNGDEIDRTVGYNSDRYSYIELLNDLSANKYLYADVISAYNKDTLSVPNSCQLARKFFFRYQYKDAIRQYKRVLALDPRNKSGYNSECRYKIAECEYFLENNLDKMAEFVKTEVKTKFVPKAYEYLINDLINKEDSLNCITLCKEAIEKYPESWEILNKYAWAICSFKIIPDYQKALEMSQKSIELNPFRPGSYSTKAWIYYEMGNKDKAIELQNQAIEIYPLPSYYQDLERFESI